MRVLAQITPVRAHPAATADLTLAEVDTWDGFVALRPAWERLESRDPEGTVFLSWAWLAEAFRNNPGRWRVLALHRGADLVCVLPLKYRVHWSTDQRAFQSEIEAGGRLLWSEYTGFLCDRDCEVAAIPALARHLQSLPWSRLSLRYVLCDRRADLLLGAFPADTFSARHRDYRINGGATDNLACPQVALPADYETYLADSLGSNTRRNFRRFMQRRIDGGGLRVSLADAASFERDIRVLLDIWRQRWQHQKGAELTARVASSYHKVMRAALDLGLLHLPVLWDGDAPLGALGHVLDPRHRRMHCIVSCRDGGAGVRNVGFMLHAHSIRWAIGNGYRVYDFCHGDEAYKFDFGARARRVGYVSVRRRGDGADRFDALCRAEALRRSIRFLDAGRTEDATAGCRQILRFLE